MLSIPRWPQVVLQGGIGCKLGPTLLAGEGLLVKMLHQLVVLHPWGYQGSTSAQHRNPGTASDSQVPPTASSQPTWAPRAGHEEGKETQRLLLVLLCQPQNWNSSVIFGGF